MKTILCPRCFSKTEVKNLAWGCANSDCPKEAIPTSSKEKSPKCSYCSKEMTMRFCPECGFQVDKIMENFKSLSISIVGSEGSGKSHFLTVLINEIRNSVGSAYDCSLSPIGGDDTMHQYNELYYKPLYEENICVPPTQQDYVRPLIYSLIFNNDDKGKTSTITFYDACGSNFRNERAMAEYNRSIINSSGIIIMLDPTQIPAIREEYIKQGKPVLEDDFTSLLSRTINLIKSGNQIKNQVEKIHIPIAICISKLDMLESRLNPASFLKYPSRNLSQPFFDVLDHSCYSMETEALIENWQASDIINQVKSQFSSFGFFGFTALGVSPDDNKHIGHISPRRVCDPFLWLMAKNQVISAKKVSLKK